jgi:uncharacterized lipoprotein YddW (UPF0748 family)/N-acetylmuramoyl-L-alanine amidase
MSSNLKNYIKKPYSIAAALLLLVLILIIISTPLINESEFYPDDTENQDEGTLQTPSPPPIEENGTIDEIDEEPEIGFRAVWVASVLNLDFPSSQGLTADEMKREIDAIVSRTAVLGLNAIIYQVRPTGDSFYQSDIFPWSHWLSGTQGEGINDFDPLAYWIEACREKDIELHAWLNPYRIIHTITNSSDPSTLAPNNPVYSNPELAVGWTAPSGNKGLFLDPGLPEARQLIIDGIYEIVSKYDVDGIHIDDYFYPGTNFDDSASFELYGGDKSLADWRRENVNELIRGIQAVIRENNEAQDKNVRWGISPTAIWKNGSNDPLGVPTTRGQESYHELYADTRLWVTEGWVDYICPQIYWYIGFETANFEPILNWWIELCGEYDVDLYIGHAAYREYEDNQPPHWRGEMIRQLNKTALSDVVKGNVFYRFHSLRGAVGQAIRSYYLYMDSSLPRQPVMVLDTLTVGIPVQDVTITGTATSVPGYNIAGTSVPDKPLFLNGEPVENRTIEGFFFIYVPLSSGTNEFTFTQEGQQDVTRTITRNAPTGGGGTAAPTPTVTRVTTARYATVSSNEVWTYPSNTTSGGSDWMLIQEQRDRVIAESSNNFVRLSSGVWVSSDAVTIRNESRVIENVFKNGIYRIDTDYDVLVWTSDIFAAVNAAYDGDTLTLSFGMHTEAPPLTLPDDLSQTLFESVRSGRSDGIPYYEFTIRNDVKFEGHYVEYEDNEFRFYMKKRKSLTQGDKPLTDIIIMIDPGHGGDSSGAIGPLGLDLTEKDLNLINSFKLAERLEALGATVRLTREVDVEMTLQERVSKSRLIKPDLFISLHVNSVAETTDATNIRGFTVWYRNANSVSISQTTLDIMHYIIAHTNRHRSINQANFYINRQSWVPSVTYEAGFIINVDDFVFLIDPIEQDRMADATVEVILEYFSR